MDELRAKFKVRCCVLVLAAVTCAQASAACWDMRQRHTSLFEACVAR